jgi:hypothetical protein
MAAAAAAAAAGAVKTETGAEAGTVAGAETALVLAVALPIVASVSSHSRLRQPTRAIRKSLLAHELQQLLGVLNALEVPPLPLLLAETHRCTLSLTMVTQDVASVGAPPLLEPLLQVLVLALVL